MLERAGVKGMHGIETELGRWEGMLRGFRIYDEIGWMRYYGSSQTGEFVVENGPGRFVRLNLDRPAHLIEYQRSLLDENSVHGMSFGMMDEVIFGELETPSEDVRLLHKNELLSLLEMAEQFARTIGLYPADFQGGFVSLGGNRFGLRVNDPFVVGKEEFERAMKGLSSLRAAGLKQSDIPGTPEHPGVILNW